MKSSKLNVELQSRVYKLLEKLPDEDRESSLLAEAVLAKDWLRPEEEEAWAHLQ